MQRLQSLGGILGKFKEIAAELGLIYAAAIWGATFYMVKGAITAVNPIALVGYRFLTASFILGAILFILKKDIFSKFKRCHIWAAPRTVYGKETQAGGW